MISDVLLRTRTPLAVVFTQKTTNREGLSAIFDAQQCVQLSSTTDLVCTAFLGLTGPQQAHHLSTALAGTSNSLLASGS
jgi:hypothetical protein